LEKEQSAINRIAFYRDALELRDRAHEILESQVSLAQRNKGLVACIFLDIDHFRPLLESRQPTFCQSILSQAEDFLRRLVQVGQAVSSGRDEFLVVVENINVEDALILAEKMRSQLAEMLVKWALSDAATDSSRLGCSAGVAVYPDHAADARELLRAAEEGMYRAKRQGRNRTNLPANERMLLKSNYYTSAQLERLRLLAQRMECTEASILREALDTFLRKHDV